MNTEPRTQRCTATTKAGYPCEAFAAATKDTCASHTPNPNRRPPIQHGTIQRARAERERIRLQLVELQQRLADVDERLKRYGEQP